MSVRLWCAVTNHGFGHMAQLVPILRHLGHAVPGLELRLASALPRPVLERHLGLPFLHDPEARDIGLVQIDPMTADLPATATAYRALHDQWPQRLEREKQAMADWRPHLLLANVPYLPLAAAGELDIPSVAVASLTWDRVLAACFPPGQAEVARWSADMRAAQARTTLALLPTPALPEPAFPHRQIIPPLFTRGRDRGLELRRLLQWPSRPDRPLFLVSLGGIPHPRLPWDALASRRQCGWILDVEPPNPVDNLFCWRRLPGHWRFQDLMASVDGVVGKPGYGMSVEAVAHAVPFLYTRRYTFPDEDVICPWLNRYGRALELDKATFDAGHWLEPLAELRARPVPELPPLDGAEQAVKRIMDFLPL
ncbi:MAG: hypothetical protein HQL82_03990 [Magnetococcales bacterium]|nr:hypothetical protein [Magnetococcales bacterium]